MWRLFSLVVVVLLSSIGVLGQEPKQATDRVPVIATSGQVEIASIRITREKVSDAAKEADLTNMQIELWLTQSAATGSPGNYLVKLVELGPIEDDTGRLL